MKQILIWGGDGRSKKRQRNEATACFLAGGDEGGGAPVATHHLRGWTGMATRGGKSGPHLVRAAPGWCGDISIPWPLNDILWCFFRATDDRIECWTHGFKIYVMLFRTACWRFGDCYNRSQLKIATHIVQGNSHRNVFAAKIWCKKSPKSWK